MRQALSFPKNRDEVSPLIRRFAHRQIAWCYCLGQSLRGQNWKTHSAAHLDDEEVEAAGQQSNPSVALLQMHAETIRELAERGELTDFQRLSMDELLTKLTDSMGKAERIRNTVFPRTYRVFLKAFIYVFITILSISLSEVEGYWEIVVTTVISIPFFLLESTSKHMQDPFSNRPTDCAVTAIARTIEINILQLLGEEDVPDPYPGADFYMM